MRDAWVSANAKEQKECKGKERKGKERKGKGGEVCSPACGDAPRTPLAPEPGEEVEVPVPRGGLRRAGAPPHLVPAQPPEDGDVPPRCSLRTRQRAQVACAGGWRGEVRRDGLLPPLSLLSLLARPHPLEDGKVSHGCGFVGGGQAVERTAVRARPLEHVQVPPPRRHDAQAVIPRAPLRARPLEGGELPACCGALARRGIPRAASCPRPLKHLEVAPVRSPGARPLVPLAPVLLGVHERVEVTPARRELARLPVPRAPTGGKGGEGGGEQKKGEE